MTVVVCVCLTGVQPGVRARQVPSARVGGWAAGLPGSDPPTPPEDTLEDELQQLDLGQEDPFLQVSWLTEKTSTLLPCPALPPSQTVLKHHCPFSLLHNSSHLPHLPFILS